MKIRAILVVLLLLASASVWAEGNSQVDLPIYPGGETSMEVNLSNEDILPMVKAMLPMMGQRFANLADQISPEDIAAIFKDVRRIQFATMDIAKPGVSESDVAGFYSKNLPKGQWTRLFWQSAKPVGTVAVYSQPGTEMLYGFRVRTTSAEGKSIRKVEVGKIEGKIDYTKLLTLAGKFMQAGAAGGQK